MDSYSKHPVEKTEKYIYSIGLILIICLIIFSLFNSLIIGLSWDEYFHHINGLARFEYLKSLGDFQKYNFRNNMYYPGLYDTISYAIGYIVLLFDQNFYRNYFPEITHFINFLFSVLSLFGFYLIVKKFFNKNIAILATLLTLLNPFFFGHMGMNTKDIIIFFALIWFSYFFYKYLKSEKNIYLNLILASFFIGFGCGVRLTFLVIVFPVIICGLIYLFKKSKGQYLNLIKRLAAHSIFAFLIIILLTVICWPHMLAHIESKNAFKFIFLIIKKTIAWNQGPKIGLINGSFYEVFNTPSTYFLDVLRFRMPFYWTLLILFTFSLLITKTMFFKNHINNFNNKFIVINIIAFFPILLAISLIANIYDNMRLFLFVVPFFSLLASFSLYYFLTNFRNSFKSKIGIILILFLFSISMYRFISLTPYQYSYVNFSYFKFKDTANKFEHDYWGATYKELIKKIKNTYSQSEINEFRISECGGGDMTLVYYLNKHLNIKKTYDEYKLGDATHLLMNNRTLLALKHLDLSKLKSTTKLIYDDELEQIIRAKGVKQTCFNYEKYKGEDLVTVSRDGLIMSTFRKISK